MAAERPERLAELDRLSQFRQKLNSRTRMKSDLERYATQIGGITGIQRKTKPQLIDLIIERADEVRDKLHEDWIERSDNGEGIWRRVLNPKTKYSKFELQGIANDLGIKGINTKSSGDLMALIHQKER
jgi:hypothetical protein